MAVELFTSGTTGAPKAALLRHDNLMSYILGSVDFMGADDDDATIVTVPPYHVAGISAVLSSVYAGRRMVQLPAFDPADWLALAARHRMSNAFLVPTMLQRIVEHLGDTPRPTCRRCARWPMAAAACRRRLSSAPWTCCPKSISPTLMA